MSDAPVTTAAATAEAPAFLRAVADLGGRRTLTASQPIYNAQGVKLLEGGASIDQGLYERLLSHRLTLPLDECVDAGTPFSADVLRDAAVAAIARWPLFARIAPAGGRGKELLDAIGAIAVPKPVGLHLMLAREMRPALFEHSILMALLCAHLVRERGGGRSALAQAAAAGLLHDLGMLHIDPDLLDSDDRLTGDRLKPVYVHPLTSSMLVDRFAGYQKEIVRAIAEHHERLDGSGYPRGIGGDAMSPLGRVLSLAEVVTAMFDGERRHPEQRVSLLLRINPRRYEAQGAAEQLALIAGDGGSDDAALRVELWALAEELLWQLHAAANQLKRRWSAAEPISPCPAALTEWLGEVEALDS